nr:hypothetical protein [uncultured Psychroserpens sp.]
MKRNIIILSTTLVILSSLIFGFTNRKNTKTETNIESNNESTINTNIPDLYYGVDTRFAAIKKTDVNKATTIYDFLNDGEKQQIAQINSVKIIMIKDNRFTNQRADGDSEQLTEAQIQLVRSADYFNHFTIRTDFKKMNTETGKLEAHFFGPHITVVPDKQATYIDGKASLINYLKTNSKADMSIIKDGELGAIKVSFVITKEGTVSNIKHDAMTTGYPSIDEKLIQLIKTIPGQWVPAENSKGEKIDQELVFTFGPANGC